VTDYHLKKLEVARQKGHDLRPDDKGGYICRTCGSRIYGSFLVPEDVHRFDRIIFVDQLSCAELCVGSVI